MKNLKVGLLLVIPALLPITIWKMRERIPNQIQMYSNSKQMEKEVSRYVPLGTNIKKAKDVMQHNGFGCALEVDSKYRRNLSLEQIKVSDQKTKLLCFKQTGWLIGGAWTIQLSFKNSRVTDCAVYYRNISPEI